MEKLRSVIVIEIIFLLNGFFENDVRFHKEKRKRDLGEAVAFVI